MIKISRILGLTIVHGSRVELDRVADLNGTELNAGDKLIPLREGDKFTLLPAKHHIHRNPRPKLLQIMEDGQDA